MSPVPDRITGQDIRDLADWNVTLLRYQIVDGLKDPLDVQGIRALAGPLPG